MRIPKDLYNCLIKVRTNKGETKDLTIEQVNELLRAGLVQESSAIRSLSTVYILEITHKGHAALDDRPIE